MQPTRPNPMLDGLRAEPERNQLRPSDEPALGRERPGQTHLPTTTGHSVGNLRGHLRFPTRLPSSAHYAPNHRPEIRIGTKSPLLIGPHVVKSPQHPQFPPLPAAVRCWPPPTPTDDERLRP